MPQSPLAIIEVTQEAIDNMAEQFPNHTKRGRFVELSQSIQDGLHPYGVHAMIFGPGVTLAAVATPAPAELPDVEDDTPSRDDNSHAPQSIQMNETKTPGQVAYEARGHSLEEWTSNSDYVRQEWEKTAQAVLAHASEAFKP